MHELRQHQRLLVVGDGVWRGHSCPRLLTDMKREAQFVICVGNKSYAASLELRKIYRVIPDKAAYGLHQIRVIDESSEDYLHPEEY